MSIVALVLLACGSKDEGGGGGGDDSNPPVIDDSAPPIDADEDGVTEAEDCDDGNPWVHPGAKEECNEIDDDCDNETDEGVLVTSYGDEDADGFGDDAAAEQGCWVPVGNAEVGGDCDDHNEDVNPGADEVCDKLDNDCDLLVDDEDVLDEGDDWYLDEDGDGYGGDKGILTCEDPGEGYDNVSTDCDDADRYVFPGAIEVCGDGVVQDCNRSAGDSFAECNGDSVRASMADVDITLGSGQTIAFTDLTGDGITDVAIGATLSAFESGAYVFPGPVSGALDVDDAIALEPAPSEDNPVATMAAGDADGDGQADVLVGTPLDGTKTRLSAGAAYVVSGPVTAGADLADADLVVLGDRDNERIGSTVQLVADWSGDGVDELLVAAGGADAGGVATECGAVWVLEGGTEGTTTTSDLMLAELRGVGSTQRFGASVASGDLTGDGVSDFLIGNGDWSEQVAYVFVGPVSGLGSSGSPDYEVVAQADDWGFGVSTAITDLDGDGASDLLVGAYISDVVVDRGGRVLAWNGPLAASVDDSSAMLAIEGTSADHQLGGSLDATDIDGDDAIDLVVQSGVYWSLGSYELATDTDLAGWAFFGPLEGTISEGSGDIQIQDSNGSRFVRVAPDVDADGRPEMAWDTNAGLTYFVNLDGY